MQRKSGKNQPDGMLTLYLYGSVTTGVRCSMDGVFTPVPQPLGGLVLVRRNPVDGV
ncbi:hypothetical protein SAMN05428984_3206 [Sphingomonas sp. OK281]|nr:hypothetical protein SAMN05428984_3206 [Sphingomonas sp. OK281]